MAALRLVRKWGVPLAAAAGAPLLVPVVRAEAGGEAAKEAPPAPPTSRMVRPSDLPIYEEPEEVLDFEYQGRERSSLEEGVGVVRKEVEGIVEATRSARERIVHIYETGKAHSMATIDYLTDEENMLPRAGAITVGGLAGLVIGARRRGGFIRKVLYTSTGVITAASLCYPRQAYAISQQMYGAAKTYGAIGYNFVVGVKPQSKASPAPAPETPKEPEKAEETCPAPPATEDTPSAPAPTPEPEGGEVRSAAALSLPPGKSLIDTLADQASDVTVWGFRLTDKGGTAGPRATPTVPEGFGSVGTAAPGGDSAKVVLGEVKEEGEADVLSSQATEGEKTAIDTPARDEGGSLVEEVVEAVKEGAAAVGEKVTEVEGKVLEIVEEGVIAVDEKVSGLEEKASAAVVEVLTPVLGEEEAKEAVEKVETVVGEAVEKVAEAVEEKVAVVVEEVAREVEEVAAVVEGVVHEVREAGEKVEKALGIVERVTKAAEKAAEVYPEVPVPEVEKVEKVVEETEAVVEAITEVAKVVEELTEEVRKKAEEVEKVAEEVVEDEKKRKEVLEEVVDKIEAKEQQDKQDAVVEKEADVPLLQPKETPQEGQRAVDTPPAAHPTPAVPQEKEGLFDRLVSFFSKPDKSAKEEQPASKATETRESAEEAKTTDAHAEKPPGGEGEAGGVPVVEEGNLVVEVVEAVKEGAAAVVEKVSEVEEKVLEKLEDEAIAVGEKAALVEEKASTAVVEVLTPVLGEEEAKEVVEKVETVVGEAVEKVAEMVEEKVAVVVEEGAREVKEEAAVVQHAVEVVEETEGKVEKALSLVERVTVAVEEAAEKFPAVPVREVEKVETVLEETAAAVESITEATKEVEGLTEKVRKEAETVEEAAKEVVESEQARKEVLEEVVETLETKEQQDKQGSGAVVEQQADIPPLQPKKAPQESQEVPQEREGLIEKLVNFFSKPDKGAKESVKEEQPASSATETVESTEEAKTTDTHLVEPPDGEGEAGSVPVGEEGNLVVEVVEAVKEGAVAVVEKVSEVEEKVLEKLEEGAIAVGEKAALVEEKASTAVVEVLTPMLGEEEAREVVEKVETVVGEAVEKVAEFVEEKVAVVVEEGAREVKEEAAVVQQAVEVMEETEEKVEKALSLVERVTVAVEEAAEKFPAVPVREVEKVETVLEETAAAVESITEATKEVEGLMEKVKKEAETVEEAAKEVVESEQARKKVLEEVVETLETKEHQDKQGSGALVEQQADVPLPQPKEAMDTLPAVQPTLAVPQEREGLLDKFVSFFSKPDKGATESAKVLQTDKEVPTKVSDSFETTEAPPKVAEEVLESPKTEHIAEAPDESIPMASVTQETQETEALTSEVKLEPEPPASLELRESTTEESVPDTTSITELEATEKSLPEAAEPPKLETTEKLESGLVGEVKGDQRQEVVEEKEQTKVEGEKGDLGEAAEWVIVEIEKQGELEEAAAEKLQPVSSEEQDSRKVEVKEEAPESEAVPAGKREGLFGQLVRLFTKDEEKPVSSGDVAVPQESVPAGPGAGGVVPMPGEGEGEQLSTGTLVKEKSVVPSEPEDTVNVPDVSVIPEDTAQAPDVLQVKDSTQITDSIIVPDDDAQAPSLPTVPDVAQVPAATQGIKDTEESPEAPLITQEEVPPSAPDVAEPVSGSLPDLAQAQEEVAASREQVQEPAGTLGTEEAAGISGHPLEEPTPPAPPPAIEKKNLFDRLASLFHKEEQQQQQLEPQLTEAAAEEVKEPVAAAEEVKEPVATAEKPAGEMEGLPPGTDQETGPLSGESEAAAAAAVPESPQEESSSVAHTEDLPLESLSEPATEGTAPTGSDVPETVVVTVEEKEEEETAPAAAAEAAPQLPQVFSPQVQSLSGGEFGEKPSVEISGETPESVASADTPAVLDTQAGEGLPATEPLIPSEAAVDQDKAREPGTEPHIVEPESIVAVPDLAKDRAEPSPREAASEGSQMSITSQGDTFIVRASPNRSSGLEAEGEGQQQAGAALRPGWSRTEAEIVQEGKDVIVKLEPTPPEKDYGQSNPEDSDMYTTRG